MDQDLKLTMLFKIWKLSGGKGWVPNQRSEWSGKGWVPNQRSEWSGNPFCQSPRIAMWIEAGFLRRANARCGFEAFRDEAVSWTDAGKLLMGKMQSEEEAQAVSSPV